MEPDAINNQVKETFGDPRRPERIDLLLTQLREVWSNVPDMRLGQLLVNLLDPEPNKLFDIEDDVVSERLKVVLRSGRWPTAKT